MYLINEKKSFIIRRADDWVEGMPQSYIPLGLDNTDYQAFKKEVLAGAELQDADGNVMTQTDAFIATLP